MSTGNDREVFNSVARFCEDIIEIDRYDKYEIYNMWNSQCGIPVKDGLVKYVIGFIADLIDVKNNPNVPDDFVLNAIKMAEVF